jgi:hypothetical protein
MSASQSARALSESLAAAHERRGPYEAWMAGPGRIHDLAALRLDDVSLLSCVAERAGPGTARPPKAAQAVKVHVPRLWGAHGFEPSFIPFLRQGAWPERPASRQQGGWVWRANLPVARATFNSRFNPDARLPRPVRRTGSAPVLMAIIDDGIPFAHHAFRAADGTRVDACWHQSAPAIEGGEALFGRVFRKAEIDRLGAVHGADEDALYRACGVSGQLGGLAMSLDTAYAHGAHTLDLFAGHWPHIDAGNARIVAVDLPNTASWDTSGFGKDAFLLAGLHFIFAEADALAAAHGLPHVPLVLNLSYGHTGGGRDGTTVFEAALDEMVSARRALGAPTIVVMPSGNAFASRLHAVVNGSMLQKGGGTAAVDLLIHPHDRTSSHVEIWWPEQKGPGDVTLQVTPPGGTSVPLPTEVAGGVAITAVPGNADPAFSLAVEHHRGGRWRAVLSLAPTEPRGRTSRAAPAGLWRLTFSLRPERTLGDASIHLWVQRDENFSRVPLGALQGLFLAPDSAVDPFGSMNGMASGAALLRIAGHDAASLRPALYSGAGSLVAKSGQITPDGPQVDAAAASERSQWLPGIVAAGSRSGVRIAASGTSSASPKVGRVFAAAFLAGNRPDDVQDTRSYARMLTAAGAVPPPVHAGATVERVVARLGSALFDEGVIPGR